MAKNNPPKIATQMRYDEIIYKKVVVIAEREYRSTNAQIEYFMKQGVEAYEKQHGVIQISDSDGE